MSKSNINRQLAQVKPGTLHVGVDLALDKNVVVVINEKAERLDRFNFPQDRGGYDYFLRRLEKLRQKYNASEIVMAKDPSNYFWKLLAREMEEKKITYHLVNAYTVKKHREGDQLDRSKDDRRDAEQIAELSRNGNYTEVRTAYSGKRLPISKLRRLHQLATTSIGVIEGLRSIQLAIQIHITSLQVLQKQLDQVISAMTACLSTLPEAPYLLSGKFLNPVSAAIFMAEIGDPKRYHAAAQWVKLAGIQPAPNTSGKKQRSRTPMSHQGRPRLRTMLYFACLRMIQHDKHFAQIYSLLQRRKDNPLTKMQALGVLMNKLLHILWALIHNQTFYNPSFGQST
jgi:transposase